MDRKQRKVKKVARVEGGRRRVRACAGRRFRVWVGYRGRAFEASVGKPEEACGRRKRSTQNGRKVRRRSARSRLLGGQRERNKTREERSRPSTRQQTVMRLVLSQQHKERCRWTTRSDRDGSKRREDRPTSSENDRQIRRGSFWAGQTIPMSHPSPVAKAPQTDRGRAGIQEMHRRASCDRRYSRSRYSRSRCSRSRRAVMNPQRGLGYPLLFQTR
jgi:hypothetical protein